MHGSPPLHLNHELCDIAYKYLKKLLEPDKIISSELYNGEILGENVFIYNCEKTFVEICELWYEENKKYNYNLNKFQIDTGHFSQMVWNKTKEVGFSFLFDEKKNKTCGIALYYPAGNILGEFKNNVKCNNKEKQ